MKTIRRALLVVVPLLLLGVAGAAVALSPRITWNPNPLVTESIAPGEQATYSVVLKNTGWLPIPVGQQLQIAAEGDIAPYITIEQPAFPKGAFRRGQAVSFDVTVAVPTDAPVGVSQGSLVLARVLPNGKVKEVWRAEGLPVSVEVVQAIPKYKPGTLHEEQTTTIDAFGGTLTVNNSASPLNGIQVIFPAGAVPSDTSVTLGYDDGQLSPRSGTFSGVVISLITTPTRHFGQPVRIIVPFVGDASIVPVPYYIAPDGLLRAAQLVTIDRAAQTFIFETFHASLFTWIFGINVAYAPDLNDIIDTGFAPGEDGFQVQNTETQYVGGKCLGMSAFAQWYWRTWETSRGGFFPKYYNILATDSDDKPIRGQDVIATRAFLSINQQAPSFAQEVALQSNLSDADQYSVIRNALVNTRQPQIIGLTTDNSGGHAVLAYALDDLSGDIGIYDNNYPGEKRLIHYNASTQSFDEYTGWFGLLFSYDNIFLIADGSLSLDEPYQNILDDADQDFQGSGNATVNITSHTSGQQVTTRNVTLHGTIQSGELLINKLRVIVGATVFATDVGLDGAFSIPVQLANGVNRLVFDTIGNDGDGTAVSVCNNTTTTDFTLVANVPLSDILMTLTWDTNDTDLDTYVIDPTGDYSAYYHTVTADGGELDQDVTTGYGPEHWTLETTDVVRYGAPYRFRVHYYSDHGHGPSNYTVTIQLYGGTAREATYTYRGNLSVSNPGNSAPDGIGPDWADIASITLTQPVATAGALTNMEMISLEAPARESIGDGLVITVPVPPLEERRK